MVSISRRRVKQQQQSNNGPLLGHNSFLSRRVRGGRGGNGMDQDRAAVAGMGLVAVIVLFWCWYQLFSASTARPVVFSSLMRNTQHERLKRTLQHPDLHVQDEDAGSSKKDVNHEEQYNAIALDILRSLDCVNLLNDTAKNGEFDGDLFGDGGGDGMDEENDRRRMRLRRRLEEAMAENDPLLNDPDSKEADGVMLDDELNAENENEDFNYDGRDYLEPTARHLFCLAAFAPLIDDDNANNNNAGGGGNMAEGSELSGAAYWKKRVKCDATAARQKALLDLWSSARSAFFDKNFFFKVLDMATQQQRTLVEHELHLWLPPMDDGTDYSLGNINNQQLNADHGGIHGLSHNLGHGKTFVDVGSAFGITSLAVSLLYPGTRIVSIEAAPPNWLMQELNWICLDDNASVSRHEKLAPVAVRVLAGVGPVSGGPQFAPMMWQKDAPSATRSWTKASDITADQDVEMDVQLKSWHSIMAEVGLQQNGGGGHGHDSNTIDVLNVDCEGCEYNLIVDLSDAEFEAISTVIGDVHWGYIPVSKKPSSKRAETTHRRLCTHENMARTAKECCAFPDLPVKSSVPGEVLVRDEEEDEDERHGTHHHQSKTFAKTATVSDIAGDFCDGFDDWAVERHLFTIKSDWGWFQLTSTAQDET